MSDLNLNKEISKFHYLLGQLVINEIKGIDKEGLIEVYKMLNFILKTYLNGSVENE